MNIKELMDWRHDCFFCHEELTIIPETYGIKRDFYIENNYFIIKSESMDLSIHIETGKVLELEQDKIIIDEFLQQSHFSITCKCLSCETSEQSYKYYGTISLAPFLNKEVSILLFNEIVHFNNLVFKNHNKQWGSIKIIKKYSANKYSKNNIIKIPSLDLKKITPKQLEYKLKTYIVFS